VGTAIPERLQRDGARSKDGDPITITSEVVAEAGEVGLGAAQGRGVALDEMGYSHDGIPALNETTGAILTFRRDFQAPRVIFPLRAVATESL
jgi:hypothetical protein